MPGTGPDIMARLVGEKLGKELKTPVVVENKAGVNGIVGTDVVVKSPADGYTFLLVDRLTITVNPPSDERLVRVNPLGIYVVALSWSKVL